MPSLPTVSAKVIADAEQFISEFKRAERAARGSTAAIEGEVGKLGKQLASKFKLADVGKDILKGAGLFGGFNIAETAAKMIAGHWERAAESAKAIEAATQDQLETTMKLIRLRQTDAQAEEAMQKRAESLGRQALELRAQKQVKAWGGNETTLHSVDASDDDLRKAEALEKERNALIVQLATLKKAHDEVAAAERKSIVDSDISRHTAALNAGLKLQDENLNNQIEAQKKANDATAQAREEAEKLAEKYREMVDPLRAYKKELEEIDRLNRDGKLGNGDIAAAASKKIQDQMVGVSLGGYFDDLDAESKINTDRIAARAKEMTDAQKKAFAEAERQARETERIVGLAADGMADSWVDSINGVEGAWGNLGQSVAREIEKIIAQILIVTPLINGLGGMLGATGFGFLGPVVKALKGYGGAAEVAAPVANAIEYRAMGGGVEAGVTYGVNEHGQELFRPNQGGTIIPAGIARGMTEKKPAGPTIFIDATGADAARISQLESFIRTLHGSIEHRSVAAVINARRRGGGLSGALA